MVLTSGIRPPHGVRPSRDMGKYRQVVDAILQGDGERAEAVTRERLLKTGERSLPHLR